jgi:HAD superfamily hydrolase (TIGR01490 family)
MNIAFFDFDGTITYNDSFYAFLRYTNSWAALIGGGVVLGPTLLGYMTGLVPNWTAKQKVFAHFFAGRSRSAFLEQARAFSRAVLPGLVKTSALERIAWHRRQNHKIAVVSASLEPYLEDWCREQGLDLICTKVEIVADRVTGNFITPNCYGPEKVRRIAETYNMKEVSYIYAYGDSCGDREMLDLAQEKFYRFLT